MEPIDDQSSPSVDDTIEICERVDSGLYGSVYRAIQKPFGRQVAVKIIKTDLKAADALSHAAPLARINHPSIVTVYTVQEVYIPELGRTVPAIIMEWVHGETFGKRLSGDKFKLAEAVLLCRDLLDGIYHLHANGLCHGDLHPGNIIILPNGHVKVIDIDANKEISLARLSALSREGAKSSDVDYCRGIIFKALRHSDVPLSILSDCETALQETSSIVSLQKEIDLVVLQAQYLDVNPVIEDKVFKSARIRACYQHCVLQYLGGKRMSNQSLRERFGLINIGSGSATTSQVIAAAKDAKLIKSDDDGAGSLRYARYLPCWG